MARDGRVGSAGDAEQQDALADGEVGERYEKSAEGVLLWPSLLRRCSPGLHGCSEFRVFVPPAIERRQMKSH